MKFVQTLTLLLLVACCGRAGTVSTLFDFSADPIGQGPFSQLVQGPNGTLYGETFDAKPDTSWGTIFAINPNGTGFTNLFTFNYTNGAFPEGGLILSGNTLYGTTYEGANGYGTVFAVGTNGLNFTNLFSFTNGIDGESPVTSLLLSGNTLYGTAEGGGLNGYGTIYAINTDSTGFTNIYQFTSANGGNPESSLILSGSTLYGTGGGGAFGDGSVFAVNTNGSG
ncbi:MAG: choice-of-anchor tandem repeat GloVer-containing protein, partial [Verrucomicrobiota bacterium]